MRSPRTYLFLVVIVIWTINTLISALLTFTYWNEVSLIEAIEQDRVIAEISGITNDYSFQEPMLLVDLTRRTILPFTVVIPQGLTLTATLEESDVIVLQPQSAALILPQTTTTLFAYTLQFHKVFPHHRTRYQINKVEESEDGIAILNKIIYLDAKEELASQLAVWMTVRDIELIELEGLLEADFSQQGDRIEQIIKSDFEISSLSSSKFRWWLIYCTSSIFILAWLLISSKKR